MLGYKYEFFKQIDENDTIENNCCSLDCDESHLVRKNCKLGAYTCDMPYVQFFGVFHSQLRERQKRWNFCKICFDSRRFKILCYDWDNLVKFSNRK